MSNPTPILNNINAFDATKGTTISFNIIGGTDIVRSNIVYIYDLGTNDLICTHLYISTESIHELPPNTDSSIVYAGGKSSEDFVNNKNYYLQIQTFTNTAGTTGGSGMSVAKIFWCLSNPSLSVSAIPAAISITSYNVSATYNTNVTDTSIPVTNIIQQYKFDLYTATGTLVQTSGNIIGSGEQEGTSTTYNITYNFSGLVVNNSYYVVVTTTSTEGMTVSAQSNTFTVSIDTPTVGAATATNNSCDGYISVVSNLSSEYGGNVSGEIASFETDSVNNVSSLKVNMEPIQEGSGTPSPTNIRPIRGHSGVNAYVSPTQSADDGTKYSQEFDVSLTPTSTDQVPYTFKAVGQDVYGDRESDKIVGGTVAWNQLLPTISTDGWEGEQQSSLSISGTTIDVTCSSGDINVYNPAVRPKNLISFVTGHKYLCSLKFKSTKAGYPYYRNSAFGASFPLGTALTEANTWKTYEAVANATSTVDWRGYFGQGNATSAGLTYDDVISFKDIVVIDLTTMFGSTIADYIYSLEQATAGAGVAWFRRYFPNDYYPYDPGTLRSVEGVSAHETVGFNQFDKDSSELLQDKITTANGTVSTLYTAFTTPFIRVLPNTTYYCNHILGSSSTSVAYVEFDSGKNYIGVGSVGYGGNVGIGGKEATFTTSKNANYIKFNGSLKAIDETNLNISDPTRNGEYEPYQKHTYPLDSSLTLRGVPKLVNGKLAFDGDIYPPSGDVQRRYGLRAYQSGDESLADAITDGTNTVYKLATPTTETAEGYEQYQICDPSGTEEFVTDSIVPVGHNTTYLTRDIFGGTVDMATGVLTVDRAMVDLGTLNWTYENGGSYTRFYSTELNSLVKKPSYDYETVVMWCTALKPTNTQAIWQGTEDGIIAFGATGTLSARIKAYTTATAFKTAMNGVQLVYPLATPTTYQLTPHQIQTLVGQNNIWSNAEEVDVTFNLPITNLLVKRQDTSDTSGKWLTLYSQPITQANDMDFIYIDFLNQHGKTYRYALVPLLTQQQGDVDVEIEGGYTVSDDVLSVFDGVFIANSNGSQKLKAATEYGDLETNQDVGVLTTIGGKYPFVVSNSNLNYHSGSISALIVPSDFYTNGDLDRLDIVERREAIEKFLTDKTAKILKDWNGNIWLITFVDNVEVSFVDDYGMGLGVLSAKWVEIGDVNDQTDLQQTGLI